MFESVDLNALLPKSQQQQQQEEDESLIPALSFTNRVIGCVTCMVLGYLLSFGSFFRLKDLLLGDPYPFVINATCGNIIALCGSCFLSGPKNQAERMFSDSRKHATVGYLSSLVLTLVVAFVKPFWGQSILLLVFLVIQYIAIGWYCLSFVPFARDLVKGWINRYFSTDE